MAGHKIAFRFLHLSVCEAAHITCAIFYVIRYYGTARLAAFGGLEEKLQQARVGLCSLDGGTLAGSPGSPVFVLYSC